MKCGNKTGCVWHGGLVQGATKAGSTPESNLASPQTFIEASFCSAHWLQMLALPASLMLSINHMHMHMQPFPMCVAASS